jgi:hypothetical protein
MRQVTEVILKGCESSDDFALQSKGRRAVRDALLCSGKDVENRSPERF